MGGGKRNERRWGGRGDDFNAILNNSLHKSDKSPKLRKLTKSDMTPC